MFLEAMNVTETLFVTPGETITSVEVGVQVIIAGLAGAGIGGTGANSADAGVVESG